MIDMLPFPRALALAVTAIAAAAAAATAAAAAAAAACAFLLSLTHNGASPFDPPPREATRWAIARGYGLCGVEIFRRSEREDGKARDG